MNSTSNNETNTNPVNNVTVLPPVGEPKKRKPISEEEKAKRAAAEKAKRKELRNSITNDLLSAMNDEERNAVSVPMSDAAFAFQDKVLDAVEEAIKEWKKTAFKVKKTSTPRTMDVMDILKRKLSEFFYDIINTEYKSKKTGEVRKFPTFTIDQWKEAAEFGFFNPTRRAPRNRKSKAETK